MISSICSIVEEKRVRMLNLAHWLFKAAADKRREGRSQRNIYNLKRPESRGRYRW